MIAVVTGASGFIGQHLVRRLIEEGHEVRCLIRAEGSRAAHDSKQFVVRFDEPRSLLECPALDRADVVFHLAATTKAIRPDAFTAANVIPTRNLLGAISARRLVPRFVFVSSQAAAGPAPSLQRPLDEEDNPRPVEAYGRSKLEAERIVEIFSDRLPTTIVRPCAVFGPRDRDFLALFRLASRGVVLYPDTADHWLSVLHVDDVVDGLLAAARCNGAMGRTYFLASEEPVTWRTVGEHISTAVGRPVRHVNIYGPIVRTASVAGELLGRLTHTATIANTHKAALARQKFWVCSGERARVELGFRPRHSLPDALRETYFWYRQSGWLHGSHRAGSAVA